MSSLVLVLKGVALGLANIIPGLSGGTVALILGIYQFIIDCLASLVSFKKQTFMSSLVCLFWIGVGGISGIFCFSFLIDWLLTYYLEPSSFFFIGVIISSIPYILISESIKIVTVPRISLCVIGILTGFLFVSFKSLSMAPEIVGNYSNTYVFLSVMIAAATMIIPGLSGSLVLVLFGTYSFVIASIKGVLITNLGLIAVAVGIGVFGCSKLISFCIKNHFQLTMSLVIGLMIGTVPGVFNGFSLPYLYLNVLSCCFGISIVWILKIFR
ncbi:hypothetical protein CL657_01040 [bacterium]|nr:hypothetical protein [bacterium]|tara:strand:+ start:1091 stop:1897 length:807 start_codon:yes stop_codon:yes gene_type:complete